MTVDEVRQQYKIVMSALEMERRKRMVFLQEPRRSKAVAEMDRAIASLKKIGEALNAAKAAGLWTNEPEQPALLSEKAGQ